MTNHPNRSLLTPRQRSVLERGNATGVCTRNELTWLQDGYPVTFRVRQLIAKGYMSVSYYRDSHYNDQADAQITDAGRAALEA